MIPLAGLDSLGPADADPPSEVRLEPTTADGEPPVWLDDYFWLELIQRWSSSPVSIHFSASPNGVLHPLVLHHVNMLSRVAKKWRLVGHCYVGDLSADGALTCAALSAYHEIRVTDGPRPGAPRSGHALKIHDALGKMRQVQAANNRTTPIIVCCPPPLPPASDPDRSAVQTPSAQSATKTIA